MKVKITLGQIWFGIGLVTLFFVSNLISSYLTKEDIYVELIKTWHIEDVDKKKLSNIPIGNGIYRAIGKCNKVGGITSIEGSYKSHLTCHAYGTTFYYSIHNGEWTPFNF